MSALPATGTGRGPPKGLTPIRTILGAEGRIPPPPSPILKGSDKCGQVEKGEQTPTTADVKNDGGRQMGQRFLQKVFQKGHTGREHSSE